MHSPQSLVLHRLTFWVFPLFSPGLPIYSDRLLPAFWPCLPLDILSVCHLPRPLHCPCCWFCLAFVTPVTTFDHCLSDHPLSVIKLQLDLTSLPLRYRRLRHLRSSGFVSATQPSPTMDSIDQLLQLRQGGLSIEEYVHQFCELTYQVPIYDEILFKDLFQSHLTPPLTCQSHLTPPLTCQSHLTPPLTCQSHLTPPLTCQSHLTPPLTCQSPHASADLPELIADCSHVLNSIGQKHIKEGLHFSASP